MDVYLLLIVLANLLFYVSSLTCVWLMRRRMRSLESGDFTLNRALREALIDECVLVYRSLVFSAVNKSLTLTVAVMSVPALVFAERQRQSTAWTLQPGATGGSLRACE